MPSRAKAQEPFARGNDTTPYTTPSLRKDTALNTITQALHSLAHRLCSGKRRRKLRELRAIDYALIHAAYAKYALAIIEQPPTTVILPSCADPVVSVIIPVHNQYLYTMRCLASLAEHSSDIAYEVILGDDNSSDATQTIEQQVHNLRVAHNPGPRGFLHNCNNAAQFARGRYIYLLNNDTQLFPHTVRALADTLDADATLAIVGSKCVKPTAKLQAAGSRWEKGGYTYDIGQDDNPLKPEFNRFAYVDYCTGASLMVRRSFWEAVQGFDTRYAPGYYEETDLCATAKQHGFTVGYQPDSEILHFIGMSFTDNAHIMLANRQKFYAKWKRFLNL